MLFIDRLPMYAWVPPGTWSDRQLLSFCLPVIVSNPRSRPHPGARPQRWALDTRFSGEAFAWRHHLEEAGLDLDRGRTGSTRLKSLDGASQEFPLRSADLWLVSNIPAFRDAPYRIALDDGIAFRDLHFLPHPESNCPLIGMMALENARLKMEMDFATRTVSVWVPGAWYRKVWLFLRRLPSGFSTAAASWE